MNRVFFFQTDTENVRPKVCFIHFSFVYTATEKFGILHLYLSVCLSLIELGCIFFFPKDLVVASAGEDKKISLWRKNGQIIGTIPVFGSESGENIEVNFPLVYFYDWINLGRFCLCRCLWLRGL